MIEGNQTVIDSVEQTLQNAARCRVDDGEDHNSNDDARDRIGKGETQPDSHQTHKRRSEVKPSIRECWPSAISGTLLMRLPTEILYCASSSLPATPTSAAAMLKKICVGTEATG